MNIRIIAIIIIGVVVVIAVYPLIVNNELPDDNLGIVSLTIRPNGDFGKTFVPSTKDANLYEDVDDITPDYEQTYISKSNIGLNYQFFRWDKSVIPPLSDIISVEVYLMGRVVGDKTAKPYVALKDTTSDETSINNKITDYMYNDWELFPKNNNATWSQNPWYNRDWKVSDFSRLAFGFCMDQKNHEVKITQVYMIITFKPTDDYDPVDAMPKTGDINDDGIVDTRDATHLSNYFNNIAGYTTIYAHPDINCDGNKNLADAGYLRQYCVNPTEYPLYPC